MSALSDTFVDKAFERLGFSELPPANMHGLEQLYRRWSLSVPFDNVRKMIALQSKSPGLLPGGSAEDFLNAWVDFGAGGTCWPTNNALYSLLIAAGFDAVRSTGSMWDMGIDNHGTIIVRLDGKDWLTDGALSTIRPLPLVAGQVHISDSRPQQNEVDPLDDGFVVWSLHPPLPHLLPCRLLERDVPESLYISNYERSREISPFNTKLYARRIFDDEVRVIYGNNLFSVSRDGQTVSELTTEQLIEELAGRFGYSPELIDRWVESGALESTLAPTEAPPRPELRLVPPSERP